MKQSTDLENRHPLAGSVVVIVGGTSGMGRGAAERLAAHGAQVLAVSRRAVSGIVQLGQGSIETAALDMADEAAVRGFFDGITTLDHLLVTATPPMPRGSFLESSFADAESALRGKVLGSWACARHAAAKIPPGGSITFVTGGMAVRPVHGAVMISAAFAAVEALARGLALELGPIRVNAVRPGVVDTEMWAAVLEITGGEHLVSLD